MTTIAKRRTPWILGLLALAWPALLLADEPAERSDEKCKEDATFLIVGDDGERVTVTMEDGQLMIVSDEDGSVSTSIIDMEAMGLLAADAVGEAMVGFEDLMAELGNMQFQYRAGRDNRVNISWDDTEFELDLDEIMSQVAGAVQLGLQEFDTAAWAGTRGRWENVSDQELRDELETLKHEMRQLRRELKRLERETDGD